MSPARVELHLIPASAAPLAAADAVKSQVVLRGQLGIVSVVDIIQLMSNRGQSWSVVLFDQGVDATVSIVNGELADARWSNKSGHEALVEIVAAEAGYFEVHPLEGVTEHTLFGLWQGNILAAVQRLDERAHSQSCIPTPQKESRREPRPKLLRKESGEYDFEAILSDKAFDQPPDVNVDPSRVNLAGSNNVLELTDLGFSALRSGNVEEAKAHWSKALEMDPNNRALQFNLKKLQGYER
jgi:hypothetical protein